MLTFIYSVLFCHAEAESKDGVNDCDMECDDEIEFQNENIKDDNG